jgi:hypothetical protein
LVTINVSREKTYVCTRRTFVDLLFRGLITVLIVDILLSGAIGWRVSYLLHRARVNASVLDGERGAFGLLPVDPSTRRRIPPTATTSLPKVTDEHISPGVENFSPTLASVNEGLFYEFSNPTLVLSDKGCHRTTFTADLVMLYSSWYTQHHDFGFQVPRTSCALKASRVRLN